MDPDLDQKVLGADTTRSNRSLIVVLSRSLEVLSRSTTFLQPKEARPRGGGERRKEAMIKEDGKNTRAPRGGG